MPTVPHPLIRACIAVLLAAELSAADVPDPAATILEDLRDANVARAASSREWQEWQAESERTYALLDSLQSQAARLRTDAASAHEASAKIVAETATAGEAHRRLAVVDGMFADAAQEIATTLAAARRACAPGAVPSPSPESAAGEPRAVFAAAVRALESCERAATTSSIEVAEGLLDGAPRAVTMVRIAGLGWWSEIEGPRAGLVVPSGGDARPTFEEVVDAPAMADAIRHAIAVAQGSRPPELLVLPVRASAITASAAAPSLPSTPAPPPRKPDAP